MVLVLFVVSVLNMAFQVSVHAAMQQPAMNPAMNMDHSIMHHEKDEQPGATDCGCPPSLCESVEAQHDQLTPSSVTTISSDFDQFYPVLLMIQPDSLSGLSSLYYENTNWRYRQVSPPPIQFTTELQI